jgi:predicted phage-related endonuclease
MYWGNVLEPVVAREYEARTKKKIAISEDMIRHPKYEFIVGNVDRIIVGENAILECKTANGYNLSEWGEEGTDDFPIEYILQCAHYAIITNADYVDLAVLIGGNNFRIYKYERNQKLEDNLIQKEINFWENYVLKNITPPPTTKEDLEKIWGQHQEGKFSIATPEIERSFVKLKEINSQIKILKEEKEAQEYLIKESIKDCEGVKDNSDNLLATWKTQKTNRFLTDKFKKDNPNTYEKYLKQTTSRRFLLKI